METLARGQAALDRQRRGRAKATKPRRRATAAARRTRTVFGEALLAECRRDTRVIGITAAMNSGTGLNILQAAMPERYFDVGIAEQQAVLFAAGLALEGARPVAAIYSTFLQRAYDQIVHDVCLQKLPVVFAMDRAGLVGDDGPTHHGVFDIAYLRCLPNIVLMAPRDEAMLVHMLHTALAHDGPSALRYPRGEAVGVPLPDTPMVDPDRHRRDPARGAGRPRERAARRAARLRHRRRQGARARPRCSRSTGSPRPSPTRASPSRSTAACVAQLAAEHELLVTVEEGVLGGGFGSAVWETLNEAGGAPTRILRVGVPDRYVTHGAPALLHEEIGYTAERIAERIRAAMERPSATIAGRD